MQEYDIYLDAEAVGKARVTQEGLYYRFTCTCDLKSRQIHRIILLRKGEEMDLGICTPQGERYCLSKRIPAKKLQEGDWKFLIKTNDQKNNGLFCEVKSAMPFAYICNLNTARFEKRDGVPGIRILTD